MGDGTWLSESMQNIGDSTMRLYVTTDLSGSLYLSLPKTKPELA